MNDKTTPPCAACQTKACAGGKDCFDDADRHRALYENPQIAKMHKAASAIEARAALQNPIEPENRFVSI